MDWSLLSGPIIGALIGYITNFLAVKMLFRPRKQLYVFGKRLPLTPGVIPKGKQRLAKAVSRLVSETLLTKEDMKEALLSENMEKKVAEKTEEIFSKGLGENIINCPGIDICRYGEKRNNLCDLVGEEIYDALIETFQKDKLKEIIYIYISKKLHEIETESMFGRFVSAMISEDRIMSLVESASDSFLDDLKAKSKERIMAITRLKADKIEKMTVYDVFSKAGMDKKEVGMLVKEIYENTVENEAESIMRNIDVASIIENKINMMDVSDLENMVMSIMKKELNTVVRMGALLGFLIGIINIFI